MKLAHLVGLAPQLQLETARLRLRRLRPTDETVALAHEQDRRVMQWIRDPQPIVAMRERFQAMLAPWDGDDAEWLAFAIEPKNQPAIQPEIQPSLIGIAVCRVTTAANETMEIGYRLTPEVHRRGYGFEAMSRLVDFLFREVQVRKLVAYCVADNQPSWRLMEKLGMRREALFREYTKLDGQWRDECVYGLLAREWRSDAT